MGKNVAWALSMATTPFAVMFAAIARIGAVAVPVSTFIKANELRYCASPTSPA